MADWLGYGARVLPLASVGPSGTVASVGLSGTVASVGLSGTVASVGLSGTVASETNRHMNR